jgi:hypothetical protein
MPDKREAERVAILGDLHGEMMIFQPMTIKEISIGGATVETSFPLHINSLHELRLMLGERSIVVKGRVVHSRISEVDQEVVTYRSGMEFVAPSDHVTTAVAQFLESIRANRGA